MSGPYRALAVERDVIAPTERPMQITHVQGIALVQAIVVGRIGEDQRQDAVIDQVRLRGFLTPAAPLDKCEFGGGEQNSSQLRSPRAQSSLQESSNSTSRQAHRNVAFRR
jgi:hypothetical protein